ncbi:MAG: site-specific DNA-methyltransferase, partial [Atopobiaceae bacterium]|nr:site-specific DNA-methyltransferase [Atopobiaceae bacterium]MBR3313838.1 site-specific DNA-methyltransferase [Atopobiaceae bacterium]
MAEFEKMDLASADLVAERIEQLKQLLPEVATESGIDFDKLRLVLGDEIDEGTERYAFTWPGKTDAIRQSQTPSTATLRPYPVESVNWDETENLYIEGDNLEVLKLLQHSYHGRVKLVYIDPPYNTGHDFVYKDKFGDTIENYREQAKLTEQSNADTSGSYHSAWCSMMLPRLRLARELMSDDGVIFISIDDNELVNLQKICREVFGDSNVLATIIVTVKPEGRRYGAFAKTHEYMICCAKDAESAILNEIVAEGASFTYSDEHGGFNLQGLRNRNVRAFNSSNRPNLHYPFYVDPSSKTAAGLYTVSINKNEGWIEVWPAVMDGLESVWRWGKEKAQNEAADLTATLGNDGTYRVFQKVRSLTQTPKTTWVSKYFQSNRGTKHVAELMGAGIFDFPKPVELLSEVVRIGSMEDSLIMDFFSGSGTLAEAVYFVNSEDGGSRKYISVQLPEQLAEKSAARKAGYTNLCEIGKERIRRAGAKIAAEIEESNKQLRLGEEPKPVPDIGFRVLKLDE